jgi:hypothetical protein
MNAIGESQAETCTAVAQGLLGRGIKTGVTTIAQNSIDVINQFYASPRDIAAQIEYLNSDKFNTSSISKFLVSNFCCR